MKYNTIRIDIANNAVGVFGDYSDKNIEMGQKVLEAINTILLSGFSVNLPELLFEQAAQPKLTLVKENPAQSED